MALLPLVAAAAWHSAAVVRSSPDGPACSHWLPALKIILLGALHASRSAAAAAAAAAAEVACAPNLKFTRLTQNLAQL